MLTLFIHFMQVTQSGIRSRRQSKVLNGILFISSHLYLTKPGRGHRKQEL